MKAFGMLCFAGLLALVMMYWRTAPLVAVGALLVLALAAVIEWASRPRW